MGSILVKSVSLPAAAATAATAAAATATTTMVVVVAAAAAAAVAAAAQRWKEMAEEETKAHVRALQLKQVAADGV
jgi:hypothetical protein